MPTARNPLPWLTAGLAAGLTLVAPMRGRQSSTQPQQIDPPALRAEAAAASQLQDSAVLQPLPQVVLRPIADPFAAP